MNDGFPFSTADLRARFGERLIASSLVVHNGAAFWVDASGPSRRVALLARPGDLLLRSFHGETSGFGDGYSLMFCPMDHANARALREALPWLKPGLLGLATSAGMGDRLGMATPGHVRALQRTLAEHPGKTILPIFAQQSIREMVRTRRSAEDVLDDATYGTFLGGWRQTVGADADHLKTTEDIDSCAAVGYSFYTFDPGAYVDGEVDDAVPSVVEQKLGGLPWGDLESTRGDLERRYIGKRVRLEGLEVELDRPAVLRGAAKYGAAVAHVVRMYRHLMSKGITCEAEVSVDETETPTSHAEHYYIASELKRLGVSWVSLATRSVGAFEKGVDYIGDLEALRVDVEGHAAIARELGPYKLSIHSGSDKFSVYPLFVAATRGQVHLKTAGTSYLEALRVLARLDPVFFREILDFARGRYQEDRASYHVSADVSKVPAAAQLTDRQMPALLEDFDAREVLHVTFGSALASYESRLKSFLRANEDAYAEGLERHFYRHLKPFAL
jgi:tagaturonate epimerase